METAVKPRTEVELEVRYAETDQMGVVHHSNYLCWFEVARTRHCEESGHHYADIEEQGHWLVVTGASIRYRQGARYGEKVVVSCALDWVATRAVQFAYEVRCEGRLLATGTTEHVWVDRKTRRHCRIPDYLSDTFLRLAGQDRLQRPKS